MRCEANISLQEPGHWKYEDGEIKPAKAGLKLNPKVEVKNINSFRAMEKAINFEIARQTEALNNKEEIFAETRGWNENNNETVSQRRKESSADYRYFPEPDIPPLKISTDQIRGLEATLPEMPAQKKKRFSREYGLTEEAADILCADKNLAAWTEQVISELDAWIEANGDSADRQDKKLAKTAVNWITRELVKYLKNDNKKIGDLKMTTENFAELICLVYQGKVSAASGQSILEKMYWEGGDPTDIMTDRGLEQLDDTAELEKNIRQIITNNPAQLTQYKAGKTTVFQYFVGQVMAATRGKANPKIVTELLEKILAE